MAIWYYVSCWTSSQVSIDYRRDDPHVIIIIIIFVVVVIVVIIITSLFSSSSLLSLLSLSSSSRRRYSPIRILTIGLKYGSVMMHNTRKQMAIHIASFCAFHRTLKFSMTDLEQVWVKMLSFQFFKDFSFQPVIWWGGAQCYETDCNFKMAMLGRFLRIPWNLDFFFVSLMSAGQGCCLSLNILLCAQINGGRAVLYPWKNIWPMH